MTQKHLLPNLKQQMMLDAICLQFEQEWRQGHQPKIESFLEDHSESERTLILPQLMLLELEYLEREGKSPAVDEYLDRFPNQHALVWSAFADHAAAEAAASDSRHFAPMGTSDQESLCEETGKRIGRYKLLEQIGEGGMGVVYMAEQQRPVRRKVAMKIIKPGMDTRQVVARFEAERQALAMMDHANIARVLDAGSTESGLPYFVMELVRGIPITEYCDQNKLPTSERLELFVNVCEAVQHAHTKGIIHRDIKPTNVLVTLHDGVPIPKIIDFGVAKAISQRLTDRTLFTAFSQMIGTPLYMSPEQAEMSGLDVDTRSDIYSLGVLLYELLTGTTPVDKKRIQTAALDEIRRIIREEDPAKPSTAISTLGEEAKTVSMRRGTDANKLRHSLSGELDWIVMKALEKDRTRRFQSAAEFTEDVQRHLAGDAVLACPPTLSYRFRKFATRYRTQVAVAGLFLGLLFGSTLLAWSLYANARTARTNEEVAKIRESEAKDEAIEQRDAATSLAMRLKQNLYTLHLSNAANAFRENDHDQTRESLSQCDEQLRGWEWKYLKNSINPQEVLELPDYPPIIQFDLNRDGNKLAVIDAQQLRIHKYPSSELIWSAKIDYPMGYLTFSPNGKQVGVASERHIAKGSITLWEADSNVPIRKLDNIGHVVMFRFSPDGRYIAIGRDVSPTESDLELWPILGSKPMWTHRCGARFPSFDFSPDGSRIYVRAAGGWGAIVPSVLSCLSANDGALIWGDIAQPTNSMVVPVPDGEGLITNGKGATTVIRSAMTGDEVRRFGSGHDHGWHYGRIDPNGRYLATTGSKHWVLYDLHQNSVVLREQNNSQSRRSAFTRDGKKLIRLGDGKFTIRNTAAREVGRIFSGHEGNVKEGHFANGGNYIRSASEDGTVRKWNLSTGLEESVIETKSPVYAISESQNYFATGADDGLRLWESDSGEPVHHWDTVGRVWFVDFSSDGKRIVAGGWSAGITVLNTETLKTVASLGDEQPQGGIRFCDPNGTRIVLLSYLDGTVRIWDTDSDLTTTLENAAARNSRGIAVSTDFQWMATGNGADIDVWDLRSLTLLKTLPGRADITCLAFDPEGSRLFSGSIDGLVQVWDAGSGERYLEINAHNRAQGQTRGVDSLAVSADGHSLVSCGGDGLVKLWETTPRSLEKQ